MFDEDGLIEKSEYDEKEDKMIVTTTYDPSLTHDANKAYKNSTSTFDRYKPNAAGLVHAGRMEMGDIIRLKNMGYNLLSPDKDEVRRALLYVQSNEPNLLLIEGKPFAKNRTRWM